MSKNFRQLRVNNFIILAMAQQVCLSITFKQNVCSTALFHAISLRHLTYLACYILHGLMLVSWRCYCHGSKQLSQTFSEHIQSTLHFYFYPWLIYIIKQVNSFKNCKISMPLTGNSPDIKFPIKRRLGIQKLINRQIADCLFFLCNIT